MKRFLFRRNTRRRRGRWAGKVSRNGRGKGLDQFKEANGQYLEPSQILEKGRRWYDTKALQEDSRNPRVLYGFVYNDHIDVSSNQCYSCYAKGCADRAISFFWVQKAG